MKTHTDNTAMAVPLQRLVRRLRMFAGWSILAVIPISTLALWFSDGLEKGIAMLIISLGFGLIVTGWIFLGVWLIAGSKYPPNAGGMARELAAKDSDSSNDING
jgi:hypothetical protein